MKPEIGIGEKNLAARVRVIPADRTRRRFNAGICREQRFQPRFDGEELWGESAEPGSGNYIDLWEQYLEPA